MIAQMSSKKVMLVGGAVRDVMLGREPKDSDYVVVDSSVAEMLSLGFTQVGADFPVFLHPETGDEYALARTERKTGDGYGGFTVETAGVTLEEDLGRRDLTINSMAMDIATGQIIDPYYGRRDLHNHVLRHTSAAFSEDPLRVLRLARFAARYSGFSVAEETQQLCQELCSSGELNSLSVERIWAEMEKGFGEESPIRFIELLSQFGALKHCKTLAAIFGEVLSQEQVQIAKLLPTIEPSHRFSVAIGTLAVSGSSLPGANNRARDCASFTKSLKNSERSATGLHSLIRQARGFSEGQSFNDLALCALVMESAGIRVPLSSRKLLVGQRVARDVKASAFLEVQGRELGLAIENARIKAISSALSIPI